MEETHINAVPPAHAAEETSETLKQINRLIRLIKTLRGKNGCPWDKKQTPKSMSVYLIEEMYELVEAIESADAAEVCEELGDVLFHIFFIASIFKDSGMFDISQVTDTINRKMIRRHPHVFGDETAESIDDIKNNWRKIKKQEKTDQSKTSVLDSIPSSLPSLMRAYRISERAAGTGFDWYNVTEVVEKVEEEIKEFKQASKLKNKKEAALEFGDILFTLVNVARFSGFHPDTALSDATRKFEKRFRYMEAQLTKKGKRIEDLSREEMDQAWEETKGEIG